MNKLTERQQAVLDFIREHQQKTGFPPTSREIQKHFGFQSQTAAMNHLRALERKNVIQRLPGKARALAENEAVRPNFRALPLLGTIPAGLPDVGESAVDAQTFAVDGRFFGLASGARAFALKVRGESMIDAQIADGDTVILEERPARNGDIVAALIDGEVTLKRLVVQRGRSYLKAENPAYPDLEPAQELAIQGVMVGLIRKAG